MLDYIFVLAAIAYVTVLPGFVLTEIFFGKLKFWKKIPLYLVLSVLASTYVTYISSLIIGYTRLTVLIDLLFFLVPTLFISLKKKDYLLSNLNKFSPLVITGIGIFALFAYALFPAIFTLLDGAFVMSGPNWQDTAMHLSIIESLAQGNFPPQAPYFSGHPLSYYYFADFHASIVNLAFDAFLPRVLVILNPFLAMTFFFTVFALCFQVSRKMHFSILGGIMAVLYSSLGFVGMLYDLIRGKGNYISLITDNAYHQSDNFLKMTPMADYFLQNRPMMVGLPAFTVTALLLISISKFSRTSLKITLLAGLITASLVKFQLFGFGISWLFAVMFFAVKIIGKKLGIREFLRHFAVFALPSVLFYIFFATTKIDQRSVVAVFLETFRFGPWDEKSLGWFIKFLFINLNLGFVVFLISLLFKRVWRKKTLVPLLFLAIALTAIPLSVTFTIYQYDMFKFFYYLVPLLAVIGVFVFSTAKHVKVSFLIFLLITITTSLTSFNILNHSHYNKAQAYSVESFLAGIWIRQNTPQKSVFLTGPSVHSAATDIAGRLRILSYITWPHSHGFNVGSDNVFTRLEDIQNTYSTGDIRSVKLKYGTKYIYYGEEERSEFPEAGILFSQNTGLKLVYDSEKISIYEIL